MQKRGVTTSYNEEVGTAGTSAMPKTNAEGHLVWNPSVGLYHKPAAHNAESYGGIVGALQDHIEQAGDTVKAYPHNFAGIIAAIQDLNVAANDVPVTPDVNPPGGNIIINPDTGQPEWDQINTIEDGMLWFDTRQGRLFVSVDKEWYQTNGADGLAFTTPDALAPDVDPVTGQFWWDAGHKTLYVFDGQWIDASGNIEDYNDGNSTPLWKVVNHAPEESLQTTMTLPLARMGPRLSAYDSITDGTILPELEPTVTNVQADLNVWFWDALLALQKFNNEQSEVIVSEDAPDTPKVGDLWYDTTTLDMSVWYEDDDTSQWVPISSPFNYDADLDTVRSAIAEETRLREAAIDHIRQQLLNFDAADNTELLKLAQDLESLGAALRREMPDVTPYATSADVNALAIELREAIANHTSPAVVDTSNLATREALAALEEEVEYKTSGYVTNSQLNAVANQIPSVTGLATRDFVTETFDSITTTFLPRGGGELSGSFTLVKDDYSAPVFDFSTAPHYGHSALKFQTALNTTTTFGTTERPYELGWQFGSEEDYCWLYNDTKVFSISKEGPACSTLILGDFNPNNSDGRVIRNKIDLKQRLTDYQFAFETMRQGVATATDFDSLKANILSALASV